jgi:hypothetical protein
MNRVGNLRYWEGNPLENSDIGNSKTVGHIRSGRKHPTLEKVNGWKNPILRRVKTPEKYDLVGELRY